jgi:hypothetical protein
MWQLINNSKTDCATCRTYSYLNCTLPTAAWSVKRLPEVLFGQCIDSVWKDISPESIIKGFKKCFVSNNTNGTEDDILSAKGYEENPSCSDTSIGSGLLTQ